MSFTNAQYRLLGFVILILIGTASYYYLKKKTTAQNKSKKIENKPVSSVNDISTDTLEKFISNKNNVNDPKLSQVFEHACQLSNKLTKLESFEQLKLYGLYKQSLLGNCEKAEPSKLSLVEHAKWESWMNYTKTQMTQNEAKLQYIFEILILIKKYKVDKRSNNNNWGSSDNKHEENNDSATRNTSTNRGLSFGNTISRPMMDDDDSESDESESESECNNDENENKNENKKNKKLNIFSKYKNLEKTFDNNELNEMKLFINSNNIDINKSEMKKKASNNDDNDNKDNDDDNDAEMQDSFLACAVQASNYELVEMLLSDCNANVNQKDICDGFTPLHIAACNNDAKMVKLLLKHGADKSIKSNGETEDDCQTAYDLCDDDDIQKLLE